MWRPQLRIAIGILCRGFCGVAAPYHMLLEGPLHCNHPEGKALSQVCFPLQIGKVENSKGVKKAGGCDGVFMNNACCHRESGELWQGSRESSPWGNSVVTELFWPGESRAYALISQCHLPGRHVSFSAHSAQFRGN